MAHYAYKEACYDINYEKFKEYCKKLESILGRELDGDSNYDGDNWLVIAEWLNDDEIEIERLRQELTIASRVTLDVRVIERLEAAEKDAERYRWLRINACTKTDIGNLWVTDGNNPMYANNLDAAIDAAMNGQQNGK